MSVIYPNLFKSRYTLKGRDWIKKIDPEDLKAFVQIGFKHSDYGRKGGKQRAKTGKRDNRGRFTKES